MNRVDINFYKIYKDLDNIMDKVLNENNIPLIKNNFVRIKNYVIRKNKNGYVVFDTTTNTAVEQVNYMISALALVEVLLKKERQHISQIKNIDMSLLKNISDFEFYRYTIQNSNSKSRMVSRQARMMDCIDKIESSRSNLEKYLT
jgi:hypothetical protein